MAANISAFTILNSMEQPYDNLTNTSNSQYTNIIKHNNNECRCITRTEFILM